MSIDKITLQYFAVVYPDNSQKYCARKTGDNDRRFWILDSLETVAKRIKPFYNPDGCILINQPVEKIPKLLEENRDFTPRPLTENEEETLLRILNEV